MIRTVNNAVAEAEKKVCGAAALIHNPRDIKGLTVQASILLSGGRSLPRIGIARG